MAVYVDSTATPYRGMIMCHMWADSLPELMGMAQSLGLRAAWLQKPPHASWVHFDICRARRAEALRRGAVETDRYGAVEHVARLKGDSATLDRIAKVRARKAAAAAAHQL